MLKHKVIRMSGDLPEFVAWSNARTLARADDSIVWTNYGHPCKWWGKFQGAWISVWVRTI